jgi:KinB signaling pathway activation protein
VTSRNWVKLFLTTLMIGGITTAIVGFIVRWDEFSPYFTEFKIMNILSAIVWLLGMGLLFSVISQMGFFAYLTVHRFGLGIFKSVSLWNAIQSVLILFVLFDLVYLRYEAFAAKGESVIPYILPAVIVLVIGLVVAWLKMNQTNKDAFIPALFFMTVATIVEWMPVLRVNEHNWLYLMVFSLMACNGYQLLILHKLNAQSQLERQKLLDNKKARNKSQKKPSV